MTIEQVLEIIASKNGTTSSSKQYSSIKPTLSKKQYNSNSKDKEINL